MATTNFKLFDENGTNMLPDGDYSSNTQRQSGVQQGVASSQLQNKFQHQMSYMVKAIADMIVEKGYTIEDTENYSNFADKVKKGISDFTFSDHDPTSADIPVKEGQFWLSDDGSALECFIAFSVSPVSWVKIFSIAISSKTEIIEESTTWEAPNSIENSFQITLVGGGAGPSITHGGSGAELKKGTFTLQEGSSINVIIGQAGASGSNGETSSFGNLLSAVGGNSNGDAPTDGMGGGGGGWVQTGDGIPGGNGGTYGGGGGGGGAGVNKHNIIVSGGNGGNGGTYGGGGGGCNSNNATTGGNGGTYGGKGGDGLSNKVGQDGTNTVGMNLDFTGTGLGGGNPQDERAGGSGGGGYGGNGGMVPYRQSSYATGGCGGGGYGGDGAESTDACGGGGGGYGGNGGKGHDNIGGGGGGYGSSNYGCGGGHSGFQNAKSGVCIITYQIPIIHFNE